MQTMKRKLRWNKNEIEIIKKYYGKKKVRELSKLINRSKDSIENKAFGLNLKSKLTPLKEINLELNENLAYILGVVAGDGSITYYKDKFGTEHFCTVLSVKDKDFADEFINNVNKIGAHCTICRVKKDLYQASASSRNLYRFIENFDLKCIKSLSDENKCAFLRGLYDSEGHIITKKNGSDLVGIGFTNKNKNLIELVKNILTSINISYREYKLLGSSFNPSGIYWRLDISRKENVKKFYRMIGFSIGRKQEKLENFIQKEEFLNIAVSARGLIRYKPVNNCYWYGKDDLNRVINLRNEGKSYNYIHKMTNIPEGTLAKWIRNETRPFRIFIENKGTVV